MYRAIQKGWTPPGCVCKEAYTQAKLGNIDSEFKNVLIGYISFNCSFGGKYFNGFSNPRPNRDYTQEAYRNLTKQIPGLMDIEFYNGSYDEFYIPPNSLIYCDPPYKNTTSYKVGSFNHDNFYNWCRLMKSNGHDIFISEYNMPPDFKCVFTKNISSSLSSKTKNSIERLFTL